MQILRAKENWMFFEQCLEWFDLKAAYLFESIDFK